MVYTISHIKDTATSVPTPPNPRGQFRDRYPFKILAEFSRELGHLSVQLPTEYDLPRVQKQWRLLYG